LLRIRIIIFEYDNENQYHYLHFAKLYFKSTQIVDLYLVMANKK